MRWRRSIPFCPNRSCGVRTVISDWDELLIARSENVRLRDENERLRRWQSVALALDAENQRLRANLHWIPDPAPAFVTARVVADAGGVYARAVLLSLGPNHGIAKGQIALDERGLVGRVTEVGARTARVLLLTDLNSRIPVILETSRSRAILVGTNGPRPRLMYWAEGAVPAEGERVVTSAEADAFPANLPVGTVHYNAANVPEVEPSARLDRLEVVRIFDYGLRGIVSPEGSGKSAVSPEGSVKPVSSPEAARKARHLAGGSRQTRHPAGGSRQTCHPAGGGRETRRNRRRRGADGAVRPDPRHPPPAQPGPAAGHGGAGELPGHLHRAADAAGRGAVRLRRTGGADTGGGDDLGLFLVPVPPGVDAAGGGVPDRAAARPARLPADRRRRDLPAGGARLRAALAALPGAPELRW